MKFKEPKSRTQSVRAAEVLSIPENQSQPLDFNLERDVTPEVWGKVEERINLYRNLPHLNGDKARNLCLLAIVNPRVADQLRHSVEFKTTVTKEFKLLQPTINGRIHENLQFLADSLEVFPELRDLRTRSSVQTKHSIAHVRSEFGFQNFSDWVDLVYILRLYPEQHQKILALAQEFKSDIKDIYLNASNVLDQEGSLPEVAKYLASGLLLYPEEAEHIRKEARRLWANLKEAMQEADNPDLEECIFSATILSAEGAVIADDGSLLITTHSKSTIPKRAGLPERSMV